LSLVVQRDSAGVKRVKSSPGVQLAAQLIPAGTPDVNWNCIRHFPGYACSRMAMPENAVQEIPEFTSSDTRMFFLA
jgi:hypothetical protein